MIKYSVIVPVYNTHNELQSIILWFKLVCEKRDDIELIIIDDGSKQPVEAPKANNLTYIYKPNGGVSSARNMGIHTAVGEYVLFLDSDDAFAKNIFSILDTKVNGSNDIVFMSSTRVYNDVSKVISNVNAEYNQQDFIKAYCIKDIRLHICSSVFKREFLQEHNLLFNEEVSFSEDVLFLVNSMFVAKKIKVLNDVLFFYNMREGSAINSPLGTKSLSHFIALKEIQRHKNEQNEKYLNYFIGSCFANLLIMLSKNKTTEPAVLTAFVDFKKSLFSPSLLRFNIIGIAVLLTRLLSILPDKLWLLVLKKWALR